MESVLPAAVFETRSQGENWGAILKRVGRFLEAGVLVVCMLDEKTGKVVVYYSDRPPRVLSADDLLTPSDLYGVSPCTATASSRDR